LASSRSTRAKPPHASFSGSFSLSRLAPGFGSPRTSVSIHNSIVVIDKKPNFMRSVNTEMVSGHIVPLFSFKIQMICNEYWCYLFPKGGSPCTTFLALVHCPTSDYRLILTIRNLKAMKNVLSTITHRNMWRDDFIVDVSILKQCTHGICLCHLLHDRRWGENWICRGIGYWDPGPHTWGHLYLSIGIYLYHLFHAMK
jgi:hypothetical protein